MSSKTERKKAAAILGSAKSKKKADAARRNGLVPKRKPSTIGRFFEEEKGRIGVDIARDCKRRNDARKAIQ